MWVGVHGGISWETLLGVWLPALKTEQKMAGAWPLILGSSSCRNTGPAGDQVEGEVALGLIHMRTVLSPAFFLLPFLPPSHSVATVSQWIILSSFFSVRGTIKLCAMYHSPGKWIIPNAHPTFLPKVLSLLALWFEGCLALLGRVSLHLTPCLSSNT